MLICQESFQNKRYIRKIQINVFNLCYGMGLHLKKMAPLCKISKFYSLLLTTWEYKNIMHMHKPMCTDAVKAIAYFIIKGLNELTNQLLTICSFHKRYLFLHQNYVSCTLQLTTSLLLGNLLSNMSFFASKFSEIASRMNSASLTVSSRRLMHKTCPCNTKFSKNSTVNTKHKIRLS